MQRWEAMLGMPVHRPSGHSRGAVFAFVDEIDRWMRSAKTRALIAAQREADVEMQTKVDGDGSLLRSFDWSQTPLGPVHQWPQDLQTRISQFIEVRQQAPFINSPFEQAAETLDRDSRKSTR